MLQLSESQKQILVTLIEGVNNQLLSIQFNEPDEDVLRLRQHANLHGQRTALLSIYNLDEQLAVAAREREMATTPETSF